MEVKKIVILGPESTGKSTLCEELAGHYRTVWVPEYARTYLHDHGMDYSYDDLLTIAKGQLALEDKYAEDFKNKLQSLYSGLSTPESPANSRPFFIDTDMHVMKVWCEFVFGKCHDWILHQVARREYDLYLLCDIDLPWVKDELREYPDLESRQKLFRLYKDMMVNQADPWVQIRGDYRQRFIKAVRAVDHLLAAQ
ncbi:MAG TPA: AAA family ATPase [Flavitalea sp.]|nr:AAA family ATPase [Flavitalea sp.]